MKKRGFTLIELLAVIVILAIIALIATPVIMKIISSSRNNSNLESGILILKTASESAMEYELTNINEKITGKYIVTSDSNLCPVDNYSSNTCSSGLISLNLDNTKPVSGYIIFDDSSKLKAENLKLSTGYICNGYTESLTCSTTATNMCTINVQYDVDTSATVTPATYEVPCGSRIDIENDSDNYIVTLKYDNTDIITIESAVNQYDLDICDDSECESISEISDDYVTVDEDTTFYLSYTGCVIKGTKISMADGTVKNVEDLKPNDAILSFNMYNGTLSESKVITILKDSSKKAKIMDIKLANGNKLTIVGMEYLFNVDKNRYMLINIDNYQDLIGQRIMINDNGKIGSSRVVSATLRYDEAEYYSVYVDKSNSYISNNVITKIVTYWSNDIFKFASNYTIDYEKYNHDVFNYGLYTYDDVKDYISYELYERLGVANYKIVVGEGLASNEYMLYTLSEIQEEIDEANKRFK